MPPDPPNSLICSDFLALATVGPRQCERLEPPVVHWYPMVHCGRAHIELSNGPRSTSLAAPDVRIGGGQWRRAPKIRSKLVN